MVYLVLSSDPAPSVGRTTAVVASRRLPLIMYDDAGGPLFFIMINCIVLERKRAALSHWPGGQCFTLREEWCPSGIEAEVATMTYPGRDDTFATD